jgi:hypothetical protein
MRFTLIVACVAILALSASIAFASGYGWGWQQQIQKPCVWGKQKPYYQQQYDYGRQYRGYGYSGYGYGGYGYHDYYRPRRRHHDPWKQWRQSYGSQWHRGSGWW